MTERGELNQIERISEELSPKKRAELLRSEKIEIDNSEFTRIEARFPSKSLEELHKERFESRLEWVKNHPTLSERAEKYRTGLRNFLSSLTNKVSGLKK